MALDDFLPIHQRISTKIVGLLLGFLSLASLAITATLILSWQLEGSSAAINEAGSLRMQTYRLSAMVAEWISDPNDTSLHKHIGTQLQAIENKFELLRKGDVQRPLSLPPASDIHQVFDAVHSKWQLSLTPKLVQILNYHQADRLAAWKSFHPDIDQYVAQVNNLVKMIEKDSEKRTFWLRSSQLVLVGMAIIGTIVVIYLMFLLIIQPATRLYEGMRRMTIGDFTVRLDVASHDEFGRMSQGFNQMADRLQDLYSSLESRVQQKTLELELQNRELALLYDISAYLQIPQQVDTVCEGFMDRICDYFQADGGSVRILEQIRNNLHMVVHRGISDEMIETRSLLKMGDCLCGQAAKQGRAVVHDLDQVKQKKSLLCHKAGFRTLSLFHIYANNQNLGFFTMYFKEPRQINTDETILLNTLGQLLGIAIKNLRLGMREREMAISEERNRVAQGLHDSIAQGLTFLNIQVQMMEDSLLKSNVDEAVQVLPALQAGVQESYEDVRELLVNFRSRLTEGDLLASLKETMNKFSRQTGIKTEFMADADGPPLPREQQLQILFIVQEALSNIRKHAHASHVVLSLTDQKDITLMLSDNGLGFDVIAAHQKGENHIGISIMHERALKINALLDITSNPGKGTALTLFLPYKQRLAA